MPADTKDTTEYLDADAKAGKFALRFDRDVVSGRVLASRLDGKAHAEGTLSLYVRSVGAIPKDGEVIATFADPGVVEASWGAGGSGKAGDVLLAAPSYVTVGRGLHSSTSQLNLSRLWSLMPQLTSTSQLNLRRFCRCNFPNSPRKVLTSSRQADACSTQKVLTLSSKTDECKPLTVGITPLGALEMKAVYGGQTVCHSESPVPQRVDLRINNGHWHHVVFVVDAEHGDGDVLTVYIDGRGEKHSSTSQLQPFSSRFQPFQPRVPGRKPGASLYTRKRLSLSLW